MPRSRYAYKHGNLDPAFEVLTTFEARHTTNTDASTQDQQWARQSLAIYRPDHITAGYVSGALFIGCPV
jgi:hypothetical protein